GTSCGPLLRAKQERGAQARRIAGVSALEGRIEEPPGGPMSQHARAPMLDGLERPGAPRAPWGRRGEPRDEPERFPRPQGPPPRTLPVDVPRASERVVGEQHREA